MSPDVEAEYARRAGEYTTHLGSMSSVHPSDVQLVTDWADQLHGRLIDAGCGPGHWSGYLAKRGADVRGVDQVASFIDHARLVSPDVPFTVGNIETMAEATGSIAGVLAWYSLIHYEPANLGVVLAEFRRVLRPGGTLLVGFFHGPAVEQFDHAVCTAYRWPTEALSEELRAAHFDVIETHMRTGHGYRPHGAILARMPAVH